MKQAVSRGDDGLIEIFLLYVHVIRVEQHTDIRLADKINHLQSILHRVEHIGFIAINRFQSQLHSVVLGETSHFFQGFDTASDFGLIGPSPNQFPYRSIDYAT